RFVAFHLGYARHCGSPQDRRGSAITRITTKTAWCLRRVLPPVGVRQEGSSKFVLFNERCRRASAGIACHPIRPLFVLKNSRQRDSEKTDRQWRDATRPTRGLIISRPALRLHESDVIALSSRQAKPGASTSTPAPAYSTPLDDASRMHWHFSYARRKAVNRTREECNGNVIGWSIFGRPRSESPQDVIGFLNSQGGGGGSIFSAIGAGINAVVSAIAGVIEAIVSAITAVVVTIFNVIADILCCRCFGSRRAGRRTGRRRGYGGGTAATY
ncbi:hypothetical protein CVT26_001941, partial [Gymnopilus dilepis]